MSQQTLHIMTIELSSYSLFRNRSIFPESHYWTHFFCYSYLYRFIFRWENKKVHKWGTEMSPQYLNWYLFSYHYLFSVRINLHFFFSSLLPAFATLLSSLLLTSISTNCKFWSETLICYLYIPIMLFSPFISNFSSASLTCVSLSISPLLISIFLKKYTMILKESTVRIWW